MTVVTDELEVPGAPVATAKTRRRKAAKKAAVKPKPSKSNAVYRCGARPLTVAGRVYAPGEVIPEASSWVRAESWERARRIVREG